MDTSAGTAFVYAISTCIIHSPQWGVNGITRRSYAGKISSRDTEVLAHRTSCTSVHGVQHTSTTSQQRYAGKRGPLHHQTTPSHAHAYAAQQPCITGIPHRIPTPHPDTTHGTRWVLPVFAHQHFTIAKGNISTGNFRLL